MKHITSKFNTHIKSLKSLSAKSKLRKENKCFIIEGQKEIIHAVRGGYKIKTLYTTKKYLNQLTIDFKINDIIPLIELITIDQKNFESLCYRSKTNNLIAIVESKSHNLNSIILKNKNPIILVIEAPEKPGNIGAIFRTADAAKIDAVLIANLKTDIYNPNIIRSSVGCIFNIKIGLGSSSEIISFLKSKKIKLFSSVLSEDSFSFLDISYKKSCAIAFGTENVGLSDQWIINSSKKIKIPMLGFNDSLNVSVATGIIIYEALRQRKLFKN